MICTMLDFSRFTQFEWDKGNIGKSYQKHGITPNEAEEVFLDKNILISEDIKHSHQIFGGCFNGALGIHTQDKIDEIWLCNETLGD